MRCRTRTPLFFCLLYSFLLSASTTNLRRIRHVSRGRSNCLPLAYLLKKAYYAQVDLIRRGLPARVIQSEFTFAINHFIRINKAARYKPLKGTCIPNEDWRKVFDESFRAKYALHYLNTIRDLVEDLTFLNFESYTTLPPLETSKEELIRTMWQTCVVRLEKRPRTRFRVSAFPFPKNVDILHDPRRDDACQQFHKFDTPGLTEHDPDARSVLIALSIVSINLYRHGASFKSLVKMLTHFVGFVFNGIRCTRLEGKAIKIPSALVEAYSRNVAMIGSTSKSYFQKGDFGIRSQAIERVFRRELHSLLSYSCWGHLQYAELSSRTSLPYKVNFLAKLFGRMQFSLVMYYSKTSRLLTRQMPSNRSLTERGVDQVFFPPKARYLQCEEGYVPMLRVESDIYPLERCCNRICYSWARLMPSYVMYSAEGCCARCNQLNRCDPGVTEMDLSDNDWFTFFIPEYGEQSQIEICLVAL